MFAAQTPYVFLGNTGVWGTGYGEKSFLLLIYSLKKGESFMALKYHYLVERKNMGATAAEHPTLLYGQIRRSDSIGFDAVYPMLLLPQAQQSRERSCITCRRRGNLLLRRSGNNDFAALKNAYIATLFC
jgi:hypothetical protein